MFKEGGLTPLLGRLVKHYLVNPYLDLYRPNLTSLVKVRICCEYLISIISELGAEAKNNKICCAFCFKLKKEKKMSSFSKVI